MITSSRSFFLCLIIPLARAWAENAPVPAPAGAHPAPEWLDRSEAWVTESLHRNVVWLDSLFHGPGVYNPEPARARCRVFLFTRFSSDPDESPEISANASASVLLPGMRDRLRLSFDFSELNSFPGAEPDEREDNPQLTLRRLGRIIDVDVGVRVKSSPTAFLRLNYTHGWETGPLSWRFLQRGFYDTGEGFGTLSSLAQHAWVGRHWMAGHTTSFRWSESTEGVEWRDAISFGRIFDLIEEDRRGNFIGHRDISRGVGMRYEIQGHHDGTGQIDTHKLSFLYRQPLFRREFLFLEITPQVEWASERDWDPVYSFRLGLDFLFWSDRI